MRRLLQCTPSVAAALLVGAVLATPAPARAEEPKRVIRFDPDALPPPTSQGPLVLTGVVTTGAFYGAAVGASFLWPDSPGAANLRIPVAGPWMKLFQTGCSDAEPDCNKFLMVAGAVLAAVDGLGQAGGLGLVLEGLVMQTGESAHVTPAAAPTPEEVSWRAVPITPGRDGVGLGVVGTF